MRAFLRPLDHDSPQSKQGDVEKEHFGECLRVERTVSEWQASWKFYRSSNRRRRWKGIE